MPPHVKKRTDRGGMFYLIDGRIVLSLKTKVRRYAEARLEQYVRGQFGVAAKITVGEYYDRWIKTKKEPLVRKSLMQAYRQHWNGYLLNLSHTPLSSVNVGLLKQLRERLLSRGLAIKTARNIISGTLCALWKDAMAEEIVDKNPFVALKWPRVEQLPPDPFTAEERDKMLTLMEEKQPFYYPFVYTMFITGRAVAQAQARIGAGNVG